jgi:hypothetical protein
MDTDTIVLEAMHTDDDNVRMLPFPVTEVLASKLDDQRAKLDITDPTLPAKQRYLSARQNGCYAAISKGAKDRELKSDRLFIPGSELQNGNGEVRISALKAAMPIPAGLHVKNITFVRENDTWMGRLEVKEEK